MDGKSEREGREGRRAVGHGAKQTECGIPTDVATLPLCHHLEYTGDEKLSFRNTRSQDCQISPIR